MDGTTSEALPLEEKKHIVGRRLSGLLPSNQDRVIPLLRQPTHEYDVEQKDEPERLGYSLLRLVLYGEEGAAQQHEAMGVRQEPQPIVLAPATAVAAEPSVIPAMAAPADPTDITRPKRGEWVPAKSPRGDATMEGAPLAKTSRYARELLGKVKAMYSFDAEQDGDLAFEKGDVIDLTMAKEHKNWWRGTLDGESGRFPKIYVERVAEELGAAEGGDSAEVAMPELPARDYHAVAELETVRSFASEDLSLPHPPPIDVRIERPFPGVAFHTVEDSAEVTLSAEDTSSEAAAGASSSSSLETRTAEPSGGEAETDGEQVTIAYRVVPTKRVPMTDLQRDVASMFKTWVGEQTIEAALRSYTHEAKCLANTATVGDALRHMCEWRVSSAPVVEVGADTFKDEAAHTINPSAWIISLVTIADIVAFFTERTRDKFHGTPATPLGWEAALFNKPITECFFHTNALEEFGGSQSLLKLVQSMANRGQHKAIIRYASGETHLVSQSDVMRLIHDHVGGIFAAAAREPFVRLRAVVPHVLCVLDTDPAGPALGALVANRIDAAAVLDKHHRLMGELNSRSMKHLTSEDAAAMKKKTVGQLLEDGLGGKAPPQPVTCKTNLSLDDLFAHLVVNKAQRVWVEAKRLKPLPPFSEKRVLGVVTLTSILRALLGLQLQFIDQSPVGTARSLLAAHEDALLLQH